MKILVLGDIHSGWHRVNGICAHEDTELVLSTGDLCNYKFEPKRVQRMLYVCGNHDSESYAKSSENPRHIFSGETHEHHGIIIAGLPGVYSPNFFDVNEKPLKYYSKSDLEKIKKMGNIDVLLTHPGPTGIGIEKNQEDIGDKKIRELIETIQPKIVFFGHYHNLYDAEIGNTRVIGLPYPKKAYALLDTSTLEVEIVKSKLDNGRYRFRWEG